MGSIDTLIQSEGLQNAVFLAGCGSIIDCHTHFAVKQADGSYKDVPRAILDSPFCLSGVSGFIEQKPDGMRVTHLHGVIGNPTESWTIHIHEGCTVLHDFVIVIAEII